MKTLYQISNPVAQRLLSEDKIKDADALNDAFRTFVDEYGWEEWMENYMEDPDGDPTDYEIEKINTKLFDLFREKNNI